jgi:beta-N-acetylhexosaminidase
MIGSVMLDLVGPEISQEEKELLAHPAVGGVIYFTRNYHDKAQLKELVRQTRLASKTPLLLAVDHEGGRVQRFRPEFTLLPAMGQIWPGANQDLALASSYATEIAWLMAVEVLAQDIDISFAPVADIWGVCDVIRNRAFHSDPTKVVTLVQAFAKGMHDAGMKTTGKHFPGHGSVKEDSHLELPVDRRSRDEIEQLDLKVFRDLQQLAALDAVMPAHVVYPAFCDKAAGFSKYWLQQVLRKEMAFDGVIFSDDLGMKGAHQAGSYQQRAEAALSAGCDMILVCNDRAGAIEVLDTLPEQYWQHSSERLGKLKHRSNVTEQQLAQSPRYLAAVELAARLKAVELANNSASSSGIVERA